jgi:hypothetical protein
MPSGARHRPGEATVEPHERYIESASVCRINAAKRIAHILMCIYEQHRMQNRVELNEHVREHVRIIRHDHGHDVRYDDRYRHNGDMLMCPTFFD